MDIEIPVDGHEARAYLAKPAAGGPAVVVLHAWWGLVQDVRDFCDRLAGEGFFALAPDLVGGQTAATVEEAERLATGARWADVRAVARAAVAWCRRELPLQPSRLAVAGFSFGAPAALDAGAQGLADAVVVFYGTTELGPDERIAVPVLGHFAESDPFEPREQVAALFRDLESRGAPATMVEYPGTGHWFFEPSRSAYNAAAAEQAWRTTLAFLKEHLAG